MNHNRSIVRDGNHFIWMGDTGWVLIDGPWFERVMKSSGKGDIRIFWQYEPPVQIARTLNQSPPKWSTLPDKIIWERVLFNNYVTNSLISRCVTNRILRVYGPQPYPQYLFDRLYFRLKIKFSEMHYRYRRHTGWRILPDGQLPVWFNALEWKNEMENE